MSAAPPATLDRVLPQHWASSGRPKIKYETYADAIVAAHFRCEGAGWLVAYPCYCGGYHVGRPRPGVTYETDDATIEIHLLALGWERIECHHWATGDPLEQWMRPECDTHLGRDEAWRQVTEAAHKAATTLIRRQPIPVPGFQGRTVDEIREIKHRTLLLAGWKAPHTPGEPWISPGPTKKKTRECATLAQAWGVFLSRQAALTGT